MTIADIAKMAGVSNAAVSRYFNGGYISEEKKEAIRKAVEETGYRPSLQAQMLRTKKSKMVGVIIPKIASYSIASIVEGIMDVLNEHDYQMLLANTANDYNRELEYLEVFKEKQVDGVIILASVLTATHKKLLKEMKVPVVVLGQKLTGIRSVYHDDYHCMYDMTKLFIEKGCKKIGLITVTQRDKAVGAERNRGVSDAVADLGKGEVVCYRAIGEFTVDSGYDKAKELIENNGQLDGLLCTTDNQAIGAMQYLKEKGIKIPEDMLLAGHGNARFTDATTPSITTIQYSYKESGMVAGNMLVDLLDGKDVPMQEVLLGYKLLEKESTRR